jgi:hypothetical protein
MDFDLITREETLKNTLDHFKTKFFDWGTSDCACLAFHPLIQRGYENPLRKLRHYSNAVQALRSLRKGGYPTLPDLVDSLGFDRIAPASAIACDILSFPSDEDAITSLALHAGGDRCLAWLPNGLLAYGPYHEATIAWRVKL